MTTLNVYARGDSATANNAALNIVNTSQQPTIQLTFDSGPSGDLLLDYNGGLADPDTTVIIGGTPYNFIVEQTGLLPFNNGKVPDALEGKQIVVISVVIDGDYTRFFFVTDGSGTLELMDAFGGGAVALIDTNTMPPPVSICFCEGTGILTSSGYKTVETLRSGDMVLTDTGNEVPILWIGHSLTTREDMRRDPMRRPICIPASSIDTNVPATDLFVSAQHRIVLESPWSALYFDASRVLTPAKHLVGAVAHWVMPENDVAYYHILLENHAVLVSNGLPTESFQPSLRSYNGISAEMRASLSETVTPQHLKALFSRPDALCSLNAYEADILIAKMFPQKTRVAVPAHHLALVS